MTRKQKPPEIVESQLYKDEELVWWGQPVAIYSLRRINWMQILMSGFIIAFAIFFINMSQSMFAESRSFGGGFGRSDSFFETVFPLFFLAVPLIMIATAGWQALKPVRDWYAATQTYYALTDKRALIVTTAFSTNVQSFYDEQMKQLNLKMYSGGVGDVIFASDTVVVPSNNTSRTRTKIVDVGFLAVPDARVAEDFIAQMFFDDDRKAK